MNPIDHDDDPVLGPVDRMLLECVRTPDGERGRRLDSLCERHPEHADELRFRFDLLSGVGFLDNAAPPLDAPRDPPPEAPREQIGEFRILRKLGGGGMGEVYLAEQTRLGRQVALKLLRPEFGRSDAARERFRREALALSKLEHPGICPVYEVGEVDGMPYLAMRYLEGRTLADLVRTARDGPRSGCVRLADSAPKATDESTTRADPTSLVAAFEQLARAMHVAHEAGLVHRDIKPQNVIVTGDGTPVIVDFGLVRDIDTDPGLTLSGDVLGTPAYLAPEQIDSSRHADARTDVYALGVTLYECLTLTRPFLGVSREALYRQILAGDCRDVRAHNRQVSKDLAAVVATAMERSPERRYPTALALAEDLRRVRLREPIVARPAGPLLRTRRWAQRNPYLASFVALLVVALVVTSVLLARLNTALTRAQSVALANAAVDVGEKDPKAGLWLALQALLIQDRRETRTQVYKLLARSHEIRRFHYDVGQLIDVEISPDGKRVVAVGDDVVVSEVGDPRSPVRVLYLKGRASGAAFLGRGGERILAGSMGGEWGIWDVETGEKLHGEDEGTWIWGVDLSPDGRIGLVRRELEPDAPLRSDNQPFLIDVESGKTTRFPHPGPLWCGAFSADTTLVATAVGNGRGPLPVGVRTTVQVRRVADGSLVWELPHEHKINGVGFLPGNRLLSAAREGSGPGLRRGTLIVWDLETGLEIDREPLVLNPWDVDVATAPDGDPIVGVAGVFGAALWRPDDPDDEPPISGIALDDRMARSVRFAPDGGSLLVASRPGSAGLYGLDGRRLLEYRGHANPLVDVEFSRDGAMVATCSWDHTYRLWRAEDHELAPFGRYLGRYVEVTHDGAVLHGNQYGYAVDGGPRVRVRLALSQYKGSPRWDPTGRRIAVATDVPGLEIHSRGGQVEHSVELPFAEHPSGVAEWTRFAVDFIDEARVLIVTETGRVAVFDCTSGVLGPVRQVQGVEGGFFTSIATHPDGNGFAAGTYDPPAAYLFDLDGRLVRRFSGHEGQVIAVTFSADGSRLATASIDKTARLYWTDWPDRKPVLLSHEGRVNDVEFSPDGKRVITSSQDGTARVWSLDGTLWASIEPGSQAVSDVAFCEPDGRWVWTMTPEGLMRWPVELDELVELAASRSAPDTDVDAERWRAIRDSVLQGR